MNLRSIFGPHPATPVAAADATGGTSDPSQEGRTVPPYVPPVAAETDTMRKIVAQLEALPLETRRFVAGFAYVLMRAAHADLTFSEAEVALMERTVAEAAGLSEAQSVLVVEIARNQSDLYGSTEDFLVTREFAASATDEQRQRLLRAAFAVGATDAGISSVESAELNEIGKELGFTDTEVDAMRMEYREQLSAVLAVRHAAEAASGPA